MRRVITTAPLPCPGWICALGHLNASSLWLLIKGAGLITANEVDSRVLRGQVLLTTRIRHLTVVEQPNNLVRYSPEKSHS